MKFSEKKIGCEEIFPEPFMSYSSCQSTKQAWSYWPSDISDCHAGAYILQTNLTLNTFWLNVKSLLCYTFQIMMN